MINKSYPLKCQINQSKLTLTHMDCRKIPIFDNAAENTPQQRVCKKKHGADLSEV